MPMDLQITAKRAHQSQLIRGNAQPWRLDLVLVSFAMVLLCLTPSRALGAPFSAAQIARMVYDRNVGQDMRMRGTMELINNKGHVRSREMTTLRKDSAGERRVVIRFNAPADIKGTAFLVIEDQNDHSTQQHLYLPALKRTRRIVAAQKGRSFVNSDFTYEDMQRHPVEDWDYRLDADDSVQNQSCYVLISTPKPDTDTSYSQIRSWIDKNTLMPLKTRFWDKKNQPIKEYRAEKVDVIDGIATELVVIMEDLKDQHQTRLTTLDVQYNIGIADHLLSVRALERGQ